MINMKVEVSGHYKLEIRSADGSVRQALEFDNLITNIGLNRMGESADWLTYCQVGSGSTTPAFTDTALAAWIASSSSTYGSIVQANQPTPPYYCSTTKTFRFSAGTATGNLSEVGVGWTTASGNLFSRALILDGLGDPTTITVLSDETLDVTYQIRQYMPTVDSGGTVILRSISHTYVGRASGVTNAYYWFLGSYGVASSNHGINNHYSAYSGAIGAIDSAPSGTSALGVPTALTYSLDSLEREHTLDFGVSVANFVGGIQSILFHMGTGDYQFGFTPAIMKTDVDELSLTFKISWARKTL